MAERRGQVVPGVTKDLLALGELEIVLDHHRRELLDARPRLPAGLRLRLARVAEQLVDLGGAEVLRVGLDL